MQGHRHAEWGRAGFDGGTLTASQTDPERLRLERLGSKDVGKQKLWASRAPVRQRT